jgi:hypothetical protein
MEFPIKSTVDKYQLLPAFLKVRLTARVCEDIMLRFVNKVMHACNLGGG